MTQNKKDLLLKDLCARLPYGTRIYAQNTDDWYDDEISTQVLSDVINEEYVVKPYLFPLSSMTEEQRFEYHNNCDVGLTEWGNELYYDCAESFDWLNSHHFDYRGLIPMGLAIDATGLNIY